MKPIQGVFDLWAGINVAQRIAWLIRAGIDKNLASKFSLSDWTLLPAKAQAALGGVR